MNLIGPEGVRESLSPAKWMTELGYRHLLPCYMVERRLKSDHASQEEVAYGRANDPDNVRSRKLPGQSDEWRKASINEAADYFFLLCFE